MSVATFEGIVEHGQIKLKADIQLPEHTIVYIIVPDMKVEQTVYLHSPRLANAKQAADFKMEIIENPSDAVI